MVNEDKMNIFVISILAIVILYFLLKGIQSAKYQNNKINNLWNGDNSNE